MNARAALSSQAIQTVLTFGALVAIAAIAWIFLVRSEAEMRTMAGDGLIAGLMQLMMRPNDSLPYFLAAALMWVAMMIGMMTPAVVPMVMVLRSIDRGQSRERDTLLFASGYLLGWSLFGVVAALLQLWLHAHGLLGGPLLAVGARGAGVILLAAGIYQLTPLKNACLHHCRSPLSFFLEYWSAGARGADAAARRAGRGRVAHDPGMRRLLSRAKGRSRISGAV